MNETPVIPRQEKVYFGIVRKFGREEPQKFYDIVTPSLMRKETPLLYCTRLDILPNGPELINWPLKQLHNAYLHMRRAGRLPPDNRGA